MLGMLMSLTTKSNFVLRSICIAIAPSSASSASEKPLSFSNPRTMRRMVEKSSTMRNFRSEALLMRVLCQCLEGWGEGIGSMVGAMLSFARAGSRKLGGRAMGTGLRRHGSSR